MAKYIIPIIYKRVDMIEVEAENINDAVTNALNEFMSVPDDNYICDSYEVDGIIEENYPNEKINWDEISKYYH